jgi:hypothetical protein
MAAGCAAAAAAKAGLAIAAWAPLTCMPTTNATAARPNLMEFFNTYFLPFVQIDKSRWQCGQQGALLAIEIMAKLKGRNESSSR